MQTDAQYLLPEVVVGRHFPATFLNSAELFGRVKQWSWEQAPERAEGCGKKGTGIISKRWFLYPALCHHFCKLIEADLESDGSMYRCAGASHKSGSSLAHWDIQWVRNPWELPYLQCWPDLWMRWRKQSRNKKSLGHMQFRKAFG